MFYSVIVWEKNVLIFAVVIHENNRSQQLGCSLSYAHHFAGTCYLVLLSDVSFLTVFVKFCWLGVWTLNSVCQAVVVFELWPCITCRIKFFISSIFASHFLSGLARFQKWFMAQYVQILGSFPVWSTESLSRLVRSGCHRVGVVKNWVAWKCNLLCNRSHPFLSKFL